MVEGRPPLADDGFLRLMSASAAHAPAWIAVRRVMGESCGLPSEAIHPHDPLADFWRMQWVGPDMLDIIFRMELALGAKIARGSIDEVFCDDCWQGDFGQFAARFVKALRGG